MVGYPVSNRAIWVRVPDEVIFFNINVSILNNLKIKKNGKTIIAINKKEINNEVKNKYKELFSDKGTKNNYINQNNNKSLIITKEDVFQNSKKWRIKYIFFLKKITQWIIGKFKFSPINYEFDAKSQINKNYEWMFFIKTKVTYNLALNIFIAIVYIFFYFLKGFHIVQIMNYKFLVIIFFSLNAIIEQLALFVINLGNWIKKVIKVLMIYGLVY